MSTSTPSNTPSSPPSDSSATSPAVVASPRQQLLNRYFAKSNPIMVTLALVYLFTYSAQSIFYYPKDTWFVVFNIVGLVIWFVFVADLLFRFVLTEPKKGFVRRNWLDIITVVLPQFRALRALRAFAGNGILSKGKGVFSGKAVFSAVTGTVIVVWVGSLMVLDAERGAQGATITSFGDSIWWAMETITTVGYGDMVPVTPFGRFLATLVMFIGISLVGVISASLAATLVKQNPSAQPAAPAPASAPSQDAVLSEIAELKKMVADLSARLPQQ